MRTRHLLSIVFFLLLIFSSCHKEKMKSCVTSLTEATIQSNGSVYMEATLDPDNSVDCEYGFCYGPDNGPLSNENSITATRNEYKISGTFLPHFNSSTRYYFRPWGATSTGNFYGNTVALDSIAANPKGSGCPLRPNTLDFWNHLYTLSTVQAPEIIDDYMCINAARAEFGVSLFIGGTVFKEGTYKTIHYGPLKDGDAKFEVYIKNTYDLPYSVFIDAGNTITITRISVGVYEVLVCDAIYDSSSGTNRLSARFIVHT
jgi:hypothetical protein